MGQDSAKSHSTLELQGSPYFRDVRTEGKGQEGSGSREEHRNSALRFCSVCFQLLPSRRPTVKSQMGSSLPSPFRQEQQGGVFWLPPTLRPSSTPLLFSSSRHPISLFSDVCAYARFHSGCSRGRQSKLWGGQVSPGQKGSVKQKGCRRREEGALGLLLGRAGTTEPTRREPWQKLRPNPSRLKYMK